jgi:hypothetical protein
MPNHKLGKSIYPDTIRSLVLYIMLSQKKWLYSAGYIISHSFLLAVRVFVYARTGRDWEVAAVGDSSASASVDIAT